MYPVKMNKHTFCDWQIIWVALLPNLLVTIPYAVFSPGVGQDLFVTSRVWERWWDTHDYVYMIVITLHKIATSERVLLRESLLMALKTGRNKPPSCEVPVVGPHHESQRWPPADSLQGTGCYQQACEQGATLLQIRPQCQWDREGTGGRPCPGRASPYLAQMGCLRRTLGIWKTGDLQIKQ